MAGGGNQAQNTGYEATMGYALIGIFLAVVVYFAWAYFQVDIRNIARWIRYAEMSVVSLFVGNDFTVHYNNMDVPWRAGYEDTPKWAADKLTYNHLAYFNALAMQPLKWVFTILSAGAAFWCLFHGPKTQFRTKLDLERLIRRQSSIFPVIHPFIKFNPSNVSPRPPGAPVPAELPLFAEALGPEEWLAYNHIPAPDGGLDAKAIARAFEQQLGPRWRGPNNLEPHKQVLLAAFCLKASRKRKEADELLGRIALCWNDRKGLKIKSDVLKEARAILKNKNLAAKTIAEANRHGFETTALLRALLFARDEGGVLAPAQFVWLRAHDRLLWYPLNNLGRQSYHMEALGALSHFKAERMTQRPIPVPKVENAANAIQTYMKTARARPIPPLDYSESEKKGVKKPVGIKKPA